MAHPPASIRIFQLLAGIAAVLCLGPATSAAAAPWQIAEGIELSSGVRAALAAGGPLGLEPVWSSSFSGYGEAVAWGDVDNDGDLDLAVGAYGIYGDKNAVYENVSGALRTSPVWTATSTAKTRTVAWGDVDNDGDLDLAAGGEAPLIYINHGGVLEREPSWVSQMSTGDATCLAWGDVDNDGDLDLAVSGGTTGIYKNSAGGLETYPSGGLYGSAGCLALGDLDNDGDLDLVLGSFFGSNQLYINVDGELQLSSDWAPAGARNTGLAWGDVDNDGDLDLAASHESDAPTQVYLNTNGKLETSPSWVGTTTRSSGVVWGDINNDGYLDLAVSVDGYLGNLNEVYLNDHGHLPATPSWQASQSLQTFGNALGDMDNDGDLDLAIASFNSPVYVYENKNGLLPSQGSYSLEYRPLRSAFGDYNADGYPDLASTPDLFSNIAGRLGIPAAWSVPSGVQVWGSVAWGDVNGDGYLDLGLGNFNRAQEYYLNQNGSFGSIPAWTATFPSFFSGYSLAWGDVEGDGDPDLAVGNYNSPNHLHLNEGGALQTGAAWVAVDTGYPYNTGSVAWGDVDNDGDLDLAVGNEYRPNQLYLNDGGILQTTPIWTAAEKYDTYTVAWGDVDNDGDLDLAVGNRYQRNHIYRNVNGMLETTPFWFGSTPVETYLLSWGDLNNDGNLDLAAANWSGPSQVYLNQDGVLPSEPSWVSNWDMTRGMAIGDVDQDGDLDLAFASYYRTQVCLNPDLPADLTYPGQPTPAIVISPFSSTATTFTGQTTNLLAPAPGYALSWIRDQPTLPVTYTLRDPGSMPFMNIHAEYSPNGGGYWLPALPYTGTQTTHLATGPAGGVITYTAPITTPLAIPDASETGGVITPGKLTFTLPITRGYAIADLDTWLSIEHLDVSDLEIWLRSPVGTEVQLYDGSGTGADLTGTWFDDEAATVIGDGSPPFTGSFRPTGSLGSPDGEDAHGKWQLIIQDGTPGNSGSLSGWGIRQDSGNSHVFTWDVNRSGFYGLSDNLVLRITALPDYRGRRSSVAGPYQYAFTASQTPPMRVRGHQVRVLVQNDPGGAVSPVREARAYRLQPGQATGSLMVDDGGKPYQTNISGYLSGRGRLDPGDHLVALWPKVITDTYTLYYTSARPTVNGLDTLTVTHQSVQTLTVSAENPLLAFNLDISLEWDARNDVNFLSNLENALGQAAAVLYDTTDGQVTIGDVNVYQDRENWLSSDIVLYAQSGIRPRASMGGVSEMLIDDAYHDGRTISNAYGPGQIRMGPNWDPFGASIAELTVDWQRALAHELAHYLLYLPDNYLGVKDGQPVNIDCRGSFMTNTYDDDYSEFLLETGWSGVCLDSIAENTTGRFDWETIKHFYSMLNLPGSFNSGPASLPLDITRVTMIPPAGAGVAETLPPRIYDIRDRSNGQLLSVPRGQGFVFQSNGTLDDLTDDRLLALGGTLSGGDGVKARGALPGDRLCVVGAPEPLTGIIYTGCNEGLSALDASVLVAPLEGWQPQIAAQAVTSTTLQVTVTLAAPGSAINVQFYPAYGGVGKAAVAPWSALDQVGSSEIYTALLTLDAPSFEGWLRVWVPASDPPREALSQLFLSPPWGPNQGGAHGGANTRAWGANNRQLGAPVASGDGQVTIFNVQDIFAETGTLALQAVNNLPNLPLWLTPVGQAYRFSSVKDFPRAIAFDYLQREVPAGYEYTLNVYYQAEGQTAWQRLPTQLEQQYNRVTAPMPSNAIGGQGLYAVLATIEMPPLALGWNQFSYPIPEARSPRLALASIDGAYTSLQWYSPLTDTWRLYDPAVPILHPEYSTMVNDLSELSFGQSYWLYVTQPITPYLGVPGVSAIASPTGGLSLADGGEFPLAETTLVGDRGLPPVTLYGPLLASPIFTPTETTRVQVWLGETLCAESPVISDAIGLVYKVQARCGGDGVSLRLVADGHSVAFAAWDNAHALYLPLRVSGSPLIDAVTPRTTLEGDLYSLTLNAESQALPGGDLTFELVNPAPGMAISQIGEFSWTPSEQQGPGVYTVTVQVTDDLLLSSEIQFYLTVLEVNHVPLIQQPVPQQVTEGNLLAFQIQAEDGQDWPVNRLTYSLLNPPRGMVIDADSGRLSWSPNEIQGPGLFSATVRVTDNGIPTLFAETVVQVEVDEINLAPEFAPVADVKILQGDLLTIDLVASDGDFPANQLAYTLLAGPAGATVEPRTGRFAWTPDLNQGTGDYTVTVRVSDDGQPALSGEARFTVHVVTSNDLELGLNQQSGTVLLGATAHYTLTVTNRSLYPASGLIFTTTLPLGLAFDDAGSDLGCDALGQTVICRLAGVDGQEMTSTHLAALVLDAAMEALPLVVNAWVAAEQIDPYENNNHAQVSSDVARSLVVFSGGQTPGPEWSSNVHQAITPSGLPFLGEFNNESVDLILWDLPDHTLVNVNFELFILRSWDGNRDASHATPLLENLLIVHDLSPWQSPDGTRFGPDLWTFIAQGESRLLTSFANWSTFTQSYPGSFPLNDYPAQTGAEAVGSLGYLYDRNSGMDSVYALQFEIVDSASTLALRFRDLGLQALEDEAWGLANIQVILSAGGAHPYTLFLPAVLH